MLLSRPLLQSTSARLRTYTSEAIKVLGSVYVTVRHNSQQKCLPLLVVEVEGNLKIDWHVVCHMQSFTEVERLLTQHKEGFKEGLGTVVGTTVKLHLNLRHCPSFVRLDPCHSHLRERLK